MWWSKELFRWYREELFVDATYKRGCCIREEFRRYCALNWKIMLHSKESGGKIIYIGKLGETLFLEKINFWERQRTNCRFVCNRNEALIRSKAEKQLWRSIIFQSRYKYWTTFDVDTKRRKWESEDITEEGRGDMVPHGPQAAWYSSINK